ncbi:LuxR C-terminal-related transcriptional regulator [Couchioplanes caeruleus]|uniref:AceR2 n=2 Tax=Couchioplanes caeruleus TaxID=56438 RepID=A0A1K0GXY1_9ACTN|nr:LuxR C-terminal-related transcriptional regulator [Couchioplanes caeruleus]OJF16284.1 AceR2 [Couchioplanes caeruleus subsp. caeruleus]ROP28384.1 putative ATPase [Couchioplanes caeruleus]
MLLERSGELTRIEAGLGWARTGRSELVVVRGPLGIGRSALLRAIPSAAGTRVLRAAGLPGDRDVAWGVVRQLLDGLPSGTSGSRDPRQVVSRLAVPGPVLLIVDDLQDADQPSLAWLAELALHLDGLPVLMVCAVRDGEVESRHPLVLQITEAADAVLRPAPLTSAAAREFLRGSLGADTDNRFADACQRAADGNPLVLAELAAHALATGMTPDAGHAAKIAAAEPVGLCDRILGVLARQPSEVRAVATAVTVLGDHAEVSLLAEVGGVDRAEVATSLRALRDLGLMAATGHPRFTRPGVRGAIEFDVPMVERLRAHTAAADALHSRGFPAEDVARHLIAVPTLQRSWLVEVLRAAALAAHRRGSAEAAIGYLHRALLDSSGLGQDRAWLLIDLADAVRDDDPQAADRWVDQAASLFDDPRDRAAVALRIPPAVLVMPRPDVVDLFRRAARDLGAPAAGDAAALDAACGVEARLWHAEMEEPGELDRALARLRRLGAVTSLESAAERSLVAVLLNAAAVTGRLNAATVADLGLRILERETLAGIRTQATLPLTVLALVAADALDGAARWLAAGANRAGPGLPPATEIQMEALRAHVLVGRGRLFAARTCAERIAHLAAPGSETEALALCVLAAVAVETGDASLAGSVAARIRPSSLSLSVALRMTRACVDADAGRVVAARQVLLACGTDLGAAGWHGPGLLPWRVYTAVLHHRAGDRRTATALLDEEHAAALAWGAPAQLGRVLRVKGHLEGGQHGVELLREAVVVLRRSANERELARALLALGQACADTAEGGAATEEGSAIALVCGASDLVGSAAAGRRAARERSLTNAERLVVSFVVRGLTNQEIASTLQVSRRAVEKHLTNCYRKLDVAGRSALVASLAAVSTPPQRIS